MLNAEQARVLRWMLDNDYDRTAWTENDLGSFLVLSGPLKATSMSKETSQSLMSKVVFASPETRAVRVFDLTEAALEALVAYEAMAPAPGVPR